MALLAIKCLSVLRSPLIQIWSHIIIIQGIEFAPVLTIKKDLGT